MLVHVEGGYDTTGASFEGGPKQDNCEVKNYSAIAYNLSNFECYLIRTLQMINQVTSQSSEVCVYCFSSDEVSKI